MSRAGSHSSRGRSVAGFTLVELLVVLTIVALVSAVALPRLATAGAGARVRAAASALAAGLREARADALTFGRDTTVTLDLESGRMASAHGVRDLDLPAGAQLHMLTVRNETVTSTVGRIRFHGDGTSTGGAVRLEGVGEPIVIRVDWLSGRIRRDDVAG